MYSWQLFLFLLLVTARASDFVFTSPPSQLLNDPDVPTFQPDSIVNIQWTTNVSGYQIFVMQNFLDRSSGANLIFDKPADQPEKGGFSWNITSSNLTNFDVSSFQVRSVDVHSLDFTAPFNISDKAISQPSATTTTTSGAPNSATQPALPISPTISRKASSRNAPLYIGIGSGLGLFLILSLFLCVGITCYRKTHKPKLEQSDSPSSNSPSPSAVLPQNNAHLTCELNPPLFKSELPTPFNFMRSMKATIPLKFELPVKDNERPCSDGPFELPVQ